MHEPQAQVPAPGIRFGEAWAFVPIFKACPVILISHFGNC